MENVLCEIEWFRIQAVFSMIAEIEQSKYLIIVWAEKADKQW